MEKYTHFKTYYEARAIHALMLRCEGLTYKQISDRIENMRESSNKTISTQSAWLLVANGASQLKHAMRKTRFRWIDPNYIDGFDPLV
jgi:hypothetical protein